MSKYTVVIDDKTYNISIELQFKQADNSNSFSEELSYECTKTEYDHCVQRSEKLDNKVYILLTVYAFLFVLLCDIIKEISNFSFPESQIQLILIITYSVLLVFNIILYVFILLQLTHLLKGVSIKRFKQKIILERDMISADSKAIARYVCFRYNQCIDTNNDILEKRYKKFNICVNCMIPIIFTSILLILICNFIL